MVESQLMARRIVDERVLDAMRAVPRHAFIPEPLRRHAYEDHPIEIGHGQTISQPYMVAVMTQLLELDPSDRVLEIGTGSGYQTAILASIASHVTSVERIPPLADRAAERLRNLEYSNIEVVTGDGTLGWRDGAPYDAIVVTAAAPSVPLSLREQLAEGGRLVCPVGPRELQYLVRVVRHGGSFHEDESVKCVFVPLIGAEGWPG
ncbi:MAG: protein-L-isoaspartate(D-aspartate) O-methyltransferase [Candidatus Hydrogenedentes bacterium]|nr:protein-L-isoaspartate(D-aspartate) O-methyltransferase [Candidatus Hydrogenedentota bacterium]